MRCRIVVLLVCLWLPLCALAGGVQATLDRSKVQLGETVTLNLRVDDGGSIGTPDLGALEQDFEVLGSSSNRSISIVNGRQSSQFIVGIVLRPKHVGELQIPSLTIAGAQTAPLTLEVTPPDPAAAANSRKHVFIEASAEPDHGYEGQQLLYTVRLYFDVNLNGGSLDDPQLPGVDVRRLGGDVDYDVERGGKTYHVIERRYALIPQRAGTLVIPSIGFQGDAVDPNNSVDPGNFFGQSGLFGNSTTVSADSPQVTLKVAPMPADWGKSTWLPARQLMLVLDGLPADGQLRVGQPLNLRMTVQATGLPAEMLPEPSLPTLDGATTYPDQPVNSTKNDGQWLHGQRTRAFAIVPQRAGTLTIPATTLQWFDVQSGQTETASVPARTFTVLPAIGAATPSVPAATVATTPAASTSVGSTPVVSTPASVTSATTSTETRWRWIALASLGLWLLSAFGWWWRRRRSVTIAPDAPSVAPASTRALREAFHAATRGGDAAAQARALLAWARAERPALQNLGELAAALASDAQRAAIAALQRRQYAGALGADSVDLSAAFAHGFAWRGTRDERDDSPLPPLYPFKLE